MSHTLSIYTTTDAPSLTHVGGDVCLCAGASAPSLSHVGKNVHLNVWSSAPTLTHVGGSVYLCAGASAPSLSHVGKNVHLLPGSSAPALTHVGGSVYLHEAYNADTIPPIKVMHGVRGRALAVSTYVLWLSEDGMLYAGCQGPLTKDQALKYLQGRTDERARVFTEAIKAL